MRPSTTSLVRAALAGVLILTAAGCGADRSAATDDDRVRVVAAFYPLQFLAERIGGDRVSVTNLAKPGTEPHDLELEPKQMAALANADLVVHLAGFQPAVDEAIEQQAAGKAFDVAAVEPLRDAAEGTGEEPGDAGKETGGKEDGGKEDGGKKAGGKEEQHANEGKDPHVWLDPVRLATIGDRLAERLAGVGDGTHAAELRERAGRLRADLVALDEEYRKGLATCQRREIVTSHAAFGYLTARYRLTQVPISGLSPEEEPTPRRMTEVAALARSHGTTTIFFETLVSPRIAETLAREVGARAEVLDPIEGLHNTGGGADYVSVMRANLGRLRTALGCT